MTDRTPRAPLGAATSVAMLLAIAAPIARAETSVPCDADLSVAAPADLVAPICRFSVHARDTLASCGLLQSAPIEIRLIHDDGGLHGCLSFYDCDAGAISVPDLAALEATLGPDDAYRALPPLVVLSNLVTHELAHALVEQAAGPGRVGALEHEYIAGALEIAAMDPDHRAALLDAAGKTPPARDGLISLGVFQLAPRAFAVNAWLHFSDPRRGCGFVRGLLTGDASLPGG